MQISYQDWSDFLLRVGAICTPAELHGLLCGMQCRAPQSDWKTRAREFMDLLEDADTAAVEAALEAQYDLINGALSEGQYSLQLLLPDDLLPVAVRAEGLALWCQGFLHGLATFGETVLLNLDDDAREALVDLAEIARLDESCGESEESEQDLLALVEYARMTLFTVVSQLRAGAVPDASVTRH
jgi:uncharacterized protein YgfB (UPF0149 family)